MSPQEAVDLIGVGVFSLVHRKECIVMSVVYEPEKVPQFKLRWIGEDFKPDCDWYYRNEFRVAGEKGRKMLELEDDESTGV